MLGLVVLSSFFVSTLASFNTYGACQALGWKPSSQPTLGCPRGTVFVSATNARARFKTIQAAVDALPASRAAVYILVDAGEYMEQVNITRKAPTTLLGVTSSFNVIGYSGNLVTVVDAKFVNQTTQNAALEDNADSAVLTVAPNKFAAWTGQGYFGATPEPIPNVFGTHDFRAYNINFENHHSVGPALALSIGFSKASFYGCAFRSWQDTVFVGKNASVYFSKTQVLGQTDYIYGFGTAFFEQCTIGARGAGCATAWKGTPDTVSPSTPWNYTNTRNMFGVYMSRSDIVRAPDADPALDLTGQHCLGRPWNNLSRVVYSECYMDESVKPGGFSIWSSTDPRIESVTYAEFSNIGPGYQPNERVDFDEILSAREDRAYELQNVFGSELSWIDMSY